MKLSEKHTLQNNRRFVAQKFINYLLDRKSESIYYTSIALLQMEALHVASEQLESIVMVLDDTWRYVEHKWKWSKAR